MNLRLTEKNKNAEWVKKHISFAFDTWDKDKILVRLFFDWVDTKSKEFQGTGTLTWLMYDIKTQILKDAMQEKALTINQNLAKRFNDCLKYCDFTQTLTLQNQYKDENVKFLMQNQMISKNLKERIYFILLPMKIARLMIYF